ncbi:Olfactory receptor 1 [Sciurus carolinensis]|uniref:Olfactory receptor 1 n=1 Tax=Sciurus carolinensis TaxID=30640 RepID=A0AA41SYU6_SCICA|nr:Olfactory receptor 1 [Sciurus carolinensis]
MFHALLVARLSFCVDNMFPHFFCDMSALLKLSCSNTQANELVIIYHTKTHSHPIPAYHCVLCTNFLLHPQVPFGSGYPQGLLYLWYHCPMIALYLCPSVNNSIVKETVMSLMYTVVTPMLNPSSTV